MNHCIIKMQQNELWRRKVKCPVSSENHQFIFSKTLFNNPITQGIGLYLIMKLKHSESGLGAMMGLLFQIKNFRLE